MADMPLAPMSTSEIIHLRETCAHTQRIADIQGRPLALVAFGAQERGPYVSMGLEESHDYVRQNGGRMIRVFCPEDRP